MNHGSFIHPLSAFVEPAVHRGLRESHASSARLVDTTWQCYGRGALGYTATLTGSSAAESRSTARMTDDNPQV